MSRAAGQEHRAEHQGSLNIVMPSGRLRGPRKPGSMVRIAAASETALRAVPTGDAKAAPGGRRKQSKNWVAGLETILNSSIQSTLESALCFFYHFLVTF